jgi:3HB-oligomer hydrolase (3HBOH)/Tannase and feruloyl esterase
MLLRIYAVATFSLLVSVSASATTRCDDVLKKLGKDLADITCFESTDLTTSNPLTTPANNSIAGLPAFAFTPMTDRGVIAPSAAKQPPIAKAVPGVQIQARIASDPTGQARFLLRLPNDWNGRLVVAGPSGTRSEFNGDIVWSDYVVQKGYAYASQNKGVLNLQFTTAADPLGCRLNPASPSFVRFYDNEAGQPFARWAKFMVAAGKIAQDGVKSAYGRPARYTYAVGTSNGGYQVRRAIETAPDVFDGGVDWEGTFVDEEAPNLLTDLPPAILNFPDYVAAGFDPNSTAAKNILAAGYGPDIVIGAASLWLNYSNSFWEVTQCQWQKRLDPGYETYVSGTGPYNYTQRRSFSDVGANMADFATTGGIKKPLITVAGTMDSLLPIDHHARAYARKVGAARDDDGHARDDRKRPAYRLYEVQNGNHIETYQDTFPQLELIMPHAQKAFDLLVQQVEQRVALPPSQCIPRGGAIVAAPAQAGYCAALFVP